MTKDEFQSEIAKVKSERIALEKLILKLNPKMKPILEDMKACVDRAVLKLKDKNDV